MYFIMQPFLHYRYIQTHNHGITKALTYLQSRDVYDVQRISYGFDTVVGAKTGVDLPRKKKQQKTNKQKKKKTTELGLSHM